MVKADEKPTTPAPRTSETHSLSSVFGAEGGLRAVLGRKFWRWVLLRDNPVLLYRGRPPKYDRARIIAVIEELAGQGVDDELELFIDRVVLGLGDLHILCPSRTWLINNAGPIWRRRRVTDH